MRRFLVHPLSPLLLFSFISTAFYIVYLTLGRVPSEAFEVLVSFGWTLLLGLWIVSDARRSKRTPCFDFGLFCFMFLPVVVPWYCIWSRGWRGALTLLMLVCIWLAPPIVATVVWLAAVR